VDGKGHGTSPKGSVRESTQPATLDSTLVCIDSALDIHFRK